MVFALCLQSKSAVKTAANGAKVKPLNYHKTSSFISSASDAKVRSPLIAAYRWW